jgi:putative DNA methylase
VTNTTITTAKKKLIEVALPLDAINKAAAYEKMPGIGPHPRGLHLWWARRPLAVARAVLFAQMVDDPSAYVEVLRTDPKLQRKAENALKARLKLWEEARTLAKKAKGSGLSVPEPGPAPTLDDMLAEQERQRLFRIIEDLVKWENTANDTLLRTASDEIWQSWRRACAENADHSQAKELFDRKKLPAFHDPFAGGGALPLEAQRLGLESYGSDLNPVAVLINKAMIEIPPRFAHKAPVNPEARGEIGRGGAWNGERAEGLAEDVRYYGQWMRDAAVKRIGQLYPKVEVTAEIVKGRPDLRPLRGEKLTVIAWVWARTVKSPNPAFSQVDVPLVSTFMLSTKLGKEAFIVPVVEGRSYHFDVSVGKPRNLDEAKNGTKLQRANFRCLMSGGPISGDYIKAEGKARRMGTRLMAIVAEGERGRVYLPPAPEHEVAARLAKPAWTPGGSLVEDARAFTPILYGISEWADLYTDRQLVALTTLCDLVDEARVRVIADAVAAGLSDDRTPLAADGCGATAYAEAVSVYLAFGVDRAADFSNTCTRWVPGNQKVMNLFGRQAIGMTWDFPEAAVLHETVGGFAPATAFIAECLKKLPAHGWAQASQQDATYSALAKAKVVSTDPPYYDNVPYADLSDLFYVWLRRSLKSVFPSLFHTLTVPKSEELVATPYRHGGKEKAEAFFLDGMTHAMHRVAEYAHPAFPVTIYYAFKQTENDGTEGVASTGWETFLDAVIRAGFAMTGTWPMRSEQEFRMRGIDSNALASSIVLVCRQRDADAPTATRREFVLALKSELPAALAHLQRGNIAPVDLAQAAIGPGMGVYTRYAKVLDADGKSLSVRDALALINQTLDEALAEQEGDFDADSRWALTWFEHSAFDPGEYGVAEQLSKSKNTSVAGMVEAGIVASKGGKVRLLRPEELPEGWDPSVGGRPTVWEMVHQLIRALGSGGEPAAAILITKLGAKAETARELAYRLFALSERKKRAADALTYNGLVQSWPEIVRLARERPAMPSERGLFDQTTE